MLILMMANHKGKTLNYLNFYTAAGNNVAHDELALIVLNLDLELQKSFPEINWKKLDKNFPLEDRFNAILERWTTLVPKHEI